MSSEFCSLVENAGSYYCKAVEIIGPVPPQFEIIYFVAFWILIGMFVVVITSPFLIGRAFGGRVR